VKYLIGYWTVGQRVLWRSCPSAAFKAHTVAEVFPNDGGGILGACRLSGVRKLAKFENFFDPIQCPVIDPRIIVGVQVRWAKLMAESGTFRKDGTEVQTDEWSKWKRGYVSEIIHGHGGVVAVLVSGLMSGKIKLALAFRSRIQYVEPKTKRERKHERSE
jgi:hypothetical protein